MGEGVPKIRDNVPDDTEMGDTRYRRYVLDKIEEGQQAVAEDRVITSEELKREMWSW